MREIVFGSSRAISLLLLLGISCFSQSLKAEEILAKHRDSLGGQTSAESRKSILAVGRVTVRFISQKVQSVEGRAVLASTRERNFLGINLNAGDYSSERFVFDGQSVHIGYAHNGRHSVLGSFLQANGWIVGNSVLAGPLARTWVLGGAENGKVSLDGVKKIDKREVYALRYSPKGGSDLDVRVFFDKDTFRLSRTEYKRVSSASIGTTPEQSSRFSETRHKVTEEFSDYKEISGSQLPFAYKLSYEVTGQNGTTMVEWDFQFDAIEFDKELDANTFAKP